jgi:hypothetical protein
MTAAAARIAARGRSVGGTPPAMARKTGTAPKWIRDRDQCHDLLHERSHRTLAYAEERLVLSLQPRVRRMLPDGGTEERHRGD